jgi:sugar/nucleoside kinase (ribokinase family)
MNNVDVLMVGNFAKDKIIVDGVEEITSGGGVYFGSIVIKKLGYKVAVATRLLLDDYSRLEEMIDQGVVVYPTESNGTSGIANYYKSADMERRICKPIGFGGKFKLMDIPKIDARVIMVTPLYAGEVDLPLLQELATRSPLALDIQGFVRVPVADGLEYRPWDDLKEGLKSVTYLKVDRAEAEFLTGQDNIHEAARALSDMGPREIVLTQSSGVTVYAEDSFYTAPFTPRSLAGRTGRGDTCFSTYITMRLDGSAEKACQWAGAITSLKQEKAGPWLGSVAEVEEILRT